MLRIGVKVGIHMLLVIAWCGLSAAAERKANPNPCNISETDAPGLNRDLSVHIYALHDFTNTVARILKEEKFVELDCLADHARSGKERLPADYGKFICYTKDCVSQFHIQCMPHSRTGPISSSGSGNG